MVTSAVITKNITPTTNKLNMLFPLKIHNGLNYSKEKLNSYSNLVRRPINVIPFMIKNYTLWHASQKWFPDLMHILLRLNNSHKADSTAPFPDGKRRCLDPDGWLARIGYKREPPNENAGAD